HLLLNGLVGVLLGWRAALAIPVGLLLQAALIGHGGYSTLGVNSCILTVPALLAWGAWQGLHRVAWLRHPWGRGGLVAGSVMLWTLSLVFSMAMFWTNPPGPLETLETATAWRITFAPYTLASVLLLSLLAALVERRWEQAPEFPLGLLIGTTAVLATMLGNSLVLLWGGQEDWHTLVLLVLVAHMPIAVLEGVVLGFTVGFLARVKPEMLGWRLAGQAKQTLNLAPENRQCTVDSLS
ncbi:MAG: energy-coupling factor ABC transporter permease, partial [Gemmataceae bacterium]